MNAHTFRPDRTHILAIVLIAMIAIIGIAWAPLQLGWLLIFPVLWIWWVLKAHTTVSEDCIDIGYAFRGNVHLDWDNFRGIGFKGSRTFASDAAGKDHSLPGVTFNSLPKLSDASRGRIPDALTAGRYAAEEKVVIIHRDGEQILLTKEEFADYKRTHPDA